MTTDTKSLMIAALRAFARQRPGLDFGNYGDHKAYAAEMRSIGKDLKEAQILLRALEHASGLTHEDIATAANNAFSGRLELIPVWIGDTAELSHYKIEYTTGQYWPTEYRRAVCAVCASALWNYRREDYVNGYKRTAKVTTDSYGIESYNGLSPGDIIRRAFVREFGRGIGNRWFN